MTRTGTDTDRPCTPFRPFVDGRFNIQAQTVFTPGAPRSIIAFNRPIAIRSYFDHFLRIVSQEKKIGFTQRQFLFRPFLHDLDKLFPAGPFQSDGLRAAYRCPIRIDDDFQSVFLLCGRAPVMDTGETPTSFRFYRDDLLASCLRKLIAFFCCYLGGLLREIVQYLLTSSDLLITILHALLVAVYLVASLGRLELTDRFFDRRLRPLFQQGQTALIRPVAIL